MLAILIERAKEEGQVTGVIPNLVENRLSILQYADDTIIFMDHNLEQAKNMKLLLSTFEQLSGLKINFRKSEMFCYGKAKDCSDVYSQIFGCESGSFPFRYLGIPMHHKKLLNRDWKEIEERFQKKLSCWKGKHLSYGGRLVLINSLLSSLAMFMLFFFQVPKGILKKLDYYRSRFFWQCDGHKKKYRLARWSILCAPKDQGGMGILNIELQNKCLLSKWLFKLINEDGVWQNLLRNKYLRNKTISQLEHKPEDSQFWTGLMSVKHDFLRLGSFDLRDGTQIRFWVDTWLGQDNLKQQYPSLYCIANRKNVTVEQVFSTRPLNLSFRRALVGDNLIAWIDLIFKLSLVRFSDNRDLFRWSLHQHGRFSVQSMYRALISEHVIPANTHIWKLKLPLKIKVFLWFLFNGKILTKDNLAK
jgi:hypothetical protein